MSGNRSVSGARGLSRRGFLQAGVAAIGLGGSFITMPNVPGRAKPIEWNRTLVRPRRSTTKIEGYIPSEEIRKLRLALNQRRHFVAARRSEIRAAKYLLATADLRLSPGSLETLQAWEKLLARTEVNKLSPHVELHRMQWLAAQDAVRLQDKEIARLLEPFAVAESLLRTVPGAGQLTAAAYIAAVADLGTVRGQRPPGSVPWNAAPTWHRSSEVARRRDHAFAPAAPVVQGCATSPEADAPDAPALEEIPRPGGALQGDCRGGASARPHHVGRVEEEKGVQPRAPGAGDCVSAAGRCLAARFCDIAVRS